MLAMQERNRYNEMKRLVLLGAEPRNLVLTALEVALYG
jgi:hypothetical protein